VRNAQEEYGVEATARQREGFARELFVLLNDCIDVLVLPLAGFYEMDRIA